VRANPDVGVTVNGEQRPMRARVADGAERKRLWAVVCDHYSGYAAYQGRAGGRVIPIVVLEPR
jgi:F420H(2)-dependent quinone reductase